MALIAGYTTSERNFILSPDLGNIDHLFIQALSSQGVEKV